MEKQIREFSVKFKIDWDGSNEIEKIRQDLEAIEALGATHVYIESDIEYDCPTLKQYAVARRLETDEEANARLSAALARAEDFRNAELEQLARLKAKYEQDNQPSGATPAKHE